MLRPIYLQPGDKVALISPAGVPKTDNIDYAVNLLRSWELIPVLSKHIYARNGQLAGTDQERLEDLQVMLDDDDRVSGVDQPLKHLDELSDVRHV